MKRWTKRIAVLLVIAVMACKIVAFWTSAKQAPSRANADSQTELNHRIDQILGKLQSN